MNDEIRLLADDIGFRAALIRPRDPRMRDEELVLRFLALVSDFPGYKPPLSQFLNEYMRSHRDEVPDDSVTELFSSTMASIASVFSSGGFQALREGRPSGNLNRALFDAVTLSVAFSDQEEFRQNADSVHTAHSQLLSDPAFLPLIGRATADRTRMHGRVRMYADSLRDVGITIDLPPLPEE